LGTRRFYKEFMTVIQTELANGSTHMVVFIPYDRRIKVGTVLTLDKDEREWTVVEQFCRIDTSDIKRGWDNNY